MELEKVKSSIQGSFDQVRKALDMREKLINRQLQVLEQQASQIAIEFIPQNEQELLKVVRTYGRINVHRLNVCSDFLNSEDYICPQDDHVLINKQLVQEQLPDDDEEVVDDGSGGQVNANVALHLVDDNANHINESLINLILNESKELIGDHPKKAKGKPPNNKEGRHGNSKVPLQILATGGDTPAPITTRGAALVDNINNNLATNNNAAATKAQKLSSKRAIDKPLQGASCGYTKKKFAALKGQSIPQPTTTTTNLPLTSNPRRPTAILPANSPYDVQAVTCEFYNRLISENELFRPKRITSTTTMAKTPMSKKDPSPVVMEVSPTSSSTSDTSSTSFKGFCPDFEQKGFVHPTFDQRVAEAFHEAADGDRNGNFLNRDKDINEDQKPTDDQDRPKQIQLWLKQIIHEPELEPMQNTDLLEFRRIRHV